jgi:hypothetical protein
VRFDNVDNSGSDFRGSIEADDKVLVEFRQGSTLSFPEMNVSADINERFGGMA